MKTLLVLVAMMVSGSTVAQSPAPFCVVSGAGTQCRFWDANSCRQTAASVNGMCVANGQQQPAVQQQLPNVAQSYQQGYQFGAQQRQAREEHEARMRLMEAQTQAAQAQAQPAQAYAFPSQQSPQSAPSSEYYRATYRCGVGAEARETPHPTPGCVVVSVQP